MSLCNSGEWGRNSEGEEIKVWDLLNKADFKPTVTLRKGECLLPLQSPENSYLIVGLCVLGWLVSGDPCSGRPLLGTQREHEAEWALPCPPAQASPALCISRRRGGSLCQPEPQREEHGASELFIFSLFIQYIRSPQVPAVLLSIRINSPKNPGFCLSVKVVRSGS